MEMAESWRHAVDLGPLSSWLTLGVLFVAVRGLAETRKQNAIVNSREEKEVRDGELRHARLITFTTEVIRSAYGDGVHLTLKIINDGDGPVLEPRPRVWLNDQGQLSEELPFTLCSEEAEGTTIRVPAHAGATFVLHVPVLGLDEEAPLTCTLGFTDMAGLRWRRAPGRQPERLIGPEAQVQPMTTQDHDESRTCAPERLHALKQAGRTP
ncbi:hypothetical protein [Streptomyces qinzhouensis]|uniref:Uncharacterized protein n=1 Tax=Streptomyces qinzhouensis TaxID=2599401 RepID=A0A5B8IKZ8_9ACTN|nr:hypothetical protein [Streptomyces qinzhouensis]QDY78139.1 hypothetical protein FQU76_18440 [Streptomyces qinzhouensis]